LKKRNQERERERETGREGERKNKKCGGAATLPFFLNAAIHGGPAGGNT
jgi:hypothetical protein